MVFGKFKFQILAFLQTVFLSFGSAASTFPDNYEDSRANFREDCQKLKLNLSGQCQSFKISSPTDKDLTVDYGYFTNKGRQLIILQSGIHGPETPAGAAVQKLFMEKHLARFVEKQIDVFLIHALNPFGFKYWRRTDEFNVNLNRNFLANGDYSIKNEGYRKLRGLFERENHLSSVWTASLMSHAKLIWSLILSGFDKRSISQAMNSGQYEFERGINFGGRSPSEQLGFLKSRLEPVIAGYSGRILFLDFHTGLGEKGILHVMPGNQPTTLFHEDIASLFTNMNSQDLKMTDVKNTSEANFYTVSGDVTEFVPKLGKNPNNVLALTMEYGTMGTDLPNQLRSASRMILENQAHFLGCSSEEVCDEAKENFRELFNPKDPEWRTRVLSVADKVFQELFASELATR